MTGDVDDPAGPGRDRQLRRAGGVGMGVGACLLAAGAALPWARTRPGIPAPNAFSGPWYVAPLVVGCAAALFVACVVTVLELWRPNVCMAFIPSAIAAMVAADQWAGPIAARVGVGYVLCLVAVAVGVLATIVLIPAERPVERPTAALSRVPVRA